MKRAGSGAWLRIAGSAALLLWVGLRTDWNALPKLAGSIRPAWLFAAFVLQACGIALASWRWWRIMRAMGRAGSWSIYLRLYFAGSLINQGVPGVIGGDAYRAWHLARRGGISIGGAVAGVLVDRASGLAALLPLGALGLALAGGQFAPGLADLGQLALVAAVVVVCATPSLLRAGVADKLSRRLPERIGGSNWLLAAQSAFGWPALIWQLPASLLVHAFAFTALACCLRSVGVEQPIAALLVAVAAVNLLGVVPISVSNWGLRETTLVALLAHWGADPNSVFLASITYGLVLLAVLLPGIWPLLKDRPVKAAERM